MKIGVFICYCGENIGRTVDCAAVAKAAAKFPGVVHSEDYKYMCSDPGQNLIKQAIREKGLDAVVVGSCSPHMHEKTFRKACQSAGVNPYLVEIANLREHCSWIHDDIPSGTRKSIDLIRIAVEKVRRNAPLVPIQVPVTKRALVIGGGISGIQAALDIANSGFEVVLVEKEPSIGGHMSQLSETFPTLDCSQCILTPRMVEVYQHPKIKLMSYSEVQSLEGFIGNFKVTIRKKARYVKDEVCTGCGLCVQKCPIKKLAYSEFEEGLATRPAVYVPFPQAVPNIPVIDKNVCTYFKSGKCQMCKKVCGREAIDFEQQDQLIQEEVGAIIVATGYKLYSIGKQEEGSPYKGYGEYGYGQYKDVINGLQFERIASASGPTSGEILRPSDNKEPKKIVFIQCVGSRDESKGFSYCSKICCMYTAKHAMLYKHKVHDGEAYVFYMDIRAGGKMYEEFVRRAIEEDGVKYIRGRVSRIFKDGDKYKVKGEDTISGMPVEIDADMVVLATAMIAQQEAPKLAQTLGIPYDKHGFLVEVHPKLRPVETSTGGIFLAGACHSPRDIPESVSMASAAAAKALVLFGSDMLEREPIIAKVNDSTCAGCFYCQKVCAYSAIERKEIRDRKGNLIKTVAYVNSGLCQGCGTCNATCPSKSVELIGFTDEQIFAEIKAFSMN
ncbi:MAG TPA: CoB--CoM heterodisulfide reductase iron-sulfur subunit A family protein [Ignavibacteriaceae bacterium]|nr:CoB--CoM heterodisulfide reductase iron-sulfur subunit A family protein [Ignavibacteriaceae bacterium]